MQNILIQSFCYVAIIILGIVLRRLGFFKAEDFTVLSKIAIRITLPASIVVSFSEQTFDVSLLMITLLSLGCGALYMFLGYLLRPRASMDKKAFSLLNLAGYNIGNFTMPFTRDFLGPLGAITTSIFDTGNAFVCLGGAFGIAASIQDGRGFSFRTLAKKLLTSVPFLCYVVMMTLNLARIRLPAPVISWARIMGNANAFIAMLMIGVGFKLTGGKDQAGYIVKHLLVRYSVAAVLAAIFYFLLPFQLEVRQALVILVFSPIASAAPAFTGELKSDVGLSSAINSISIICSIVIIVFLLTVMLP